MRIGRRNGRQATLSVLLLATATWLAPPAVRAETVAWVSGEVRLNVRRGAGNEYEVIGGVSSNDLVTVIAEENDWTHVRLADGQEGWIPEGYLSKVPPPQVRLNELEGEAGQLREKLESTTAEAERLRRENRSLEERVETLTAQSHDLEQARRRAWIVGASLLVVGMLAGAVLRRDPRRRRAARLRV